MTDRPPTPWFHLKDGWWFTRTADGSVNIVKRRNAEPNSEVIAAILIPWNEWASVVATVSKDGENNYGWYEAVEFHNEERHNDSLKKLGPHGAFDLDERDTGEGFGPMGNRP